MKAAVYLLLGGLLMVATLTWLPQLAPLGPERLVSGREPSSSNINLPLDSLNRPRDSGPAGLYLSQLPSQLPPGSLEPAVVSQGQVGLLRLRLSPGERLEGSFQGRTLWFDWYRGYAWALVPVGLGLADGRYSLNLATGSTSDNVGVSPSVQVVNRRAVEEDWSLPWGGIGGEPPLTNFPTVGERLWQGPFTWPLVGTITSHFGARRSHINGIWGYHEGLDIAGPTGAPVVAANRGRVVAAGMSPSGANRVVIDHGLGVHSVYLHFSEVLVKEGDLVQKGQVIGLVGSTGFSTGPHLHWEMRVSGTAVDPIEWTQRSFPE